MSPTSLLCARIRSPLTGFGYRSGTQQDDQAQRRDEGPCGTVLGREALDYLLAPTASESDRFSVTNPPAPLCTSRAQESWAHRALAGLRTSTFLMVVVVQYEESTHFNLGQVSMPPVPCPGPRAHRPLAVPSQFLSHSGVPFQVDFGARIGVIFHDYGLIMDEATCNLRCGGPARLQQVCALSEVHFLQRTPTYLWCTSR